MLPLAFKHVTLSCPVNTVTVEFHNPDEAQASVVVGTGDHDRAELWTT